MALSIEQQLAALFRETGSAHHQAFAATNGVDPDWPIWYADYLAPRLERVVGRAIETATLAADLRAVDAEHRHVAPGEPWSDYYARWFVLRLAR
jgi:hypothetical protein